MKLKTHNITLKGDRITLRPMTENDWEILANGKMSAPKIELPPKNKPPFHCTEPGKGAYPMQVNA